MPATSIRGAAISWSCEGLAEDPMAGVLEMLEPTIASTETAERIHLDLRPATAQTAADPGEEGWIPSFFHGAVQAYRGSSGFLLWDRSSRVIIPSGSAPASAEVVAPGEERHAGSTRVLFQIALTILLRRARLFHLHAAAVVRPDGAAILIAGSSGAGKTTTALALLEAGADYLGDDAIFLHPSADPGQIAHAVAFPRAFHLGPATLSAFPRLLALAGPAPARSDKRPVDPRVAFPGRHRPEIPLSRGRTIAVFPSIGGGKTTEISAISKAEAFGHLLAESAALIVEGMPFRDENLAILRALVDAASPVEIRLGEDALAAPGSAVAPRLLNFL